MATSVPNSPLERNRWCLRVDRRAWDAWRAATPAVAEASEELGEELRVVRFATPVSDDAIARSLWPRYALPVAWTFDPRDAGAFARVLAEAPAGCDLRLAAVRRHARFHVERMRALAPGRAESGPALHVLVSDTLAVAGVASDPALTVFAPTPHVVRRGEAPSRAGAKLEEALALLAALGERPRPDASWIDVGAFPGGMTRALLERGARVVALDKNPPRGILLDPRVRYWQGDAGAFDEPSLVDGAAGLVCDVNGEPRAAASAAARLATRLALGAHVVPTVKLRRPEDGPAEVAAATALFGAAGVRLLTARHLPANRQEVCWLGRKVGLIEPGSC